MNSNSFKDKEWLLLMKRESCLKYFVHEQRSTINVPLRKSNLIEGNKSGKGTPTLVEILKRYKLI